MTKSRLRICVVSAIYHPSLGGLGRQAQLLTERLADEGVDVFVISRNVKGLPPARFSSKVKRYTAHAICPSILYLPKASVINILISLSFSLSAAAILFLKRKDYDIIHFHGASIPLCVNVPLLKVLRKKVVGKVAAAKLGTEVGSLKGRYLGVGTAITKVMRCVDRFIAISSEIEEGLINDGIDRSKIIRISNFIDLKDYRKIGPAEKLAMKKKIGADSKKVVVFSGRIFERKGINFLLAAWKQVVQIEPDALLILLGDGPLKNKMMELAADLDIAGSVDFRGHVDNVSDYLYAADIFVLPSLQEGMPNSLLEAMACGLPSVVTEIGGVVDIIKDGHNGILAAPSNSRSLEEGILLLLQNKALSREIALNALKTIEEDYSLDVTVEKYLKLYDYLMNS